MKAPSRFDDTPPGAGRWVTGLFGIFLSGVAIAILLVADRPLGFGVIAAAVGVGVLGVDALVCAFRNRRSLVSRVGPLP